MDTDDWYEKHTTGNYINDKIIYKVKPEEMDEFRKYVILSCEEPHYDTIYKIFRELDKNALYYTIYVSDDVDNYSYVSVLTVKDELGLAKLQFDKALNTVKDLGVNIWIENLLDC